jgi:23S rRNA pseudouridine2457 synthase
MLPMPKKNYKYVLFNKPFEVLPQFTDRKGRPTLKKYLPIPEIYPVGRLDFDSEGLLLLTDDGALNHQLASPENKQPKTYWVQVEHVPTEEELEKLKAGVLIEGRKTHRAEARIIEAPAGLWERSRPIRERKSVPTAWLEITITEGKKRQVRRMTAAVGHPCLRLIRVKIGPFELGNLQPGEYQIIEKFNRASLI